MNIDLILLAAGAFLFAGTVKGLTGMGLPTALISILSQFVDPRIAIALLFVPSLALNVWQVASSGNIVRNLRAVLPFAIVMFAGIWYFSRFAASLDVEPMMIGVGSVIVLFVFSNFLKPPPPIPPRLEMPVQLFAGACAGVLGGLTAIWSPPMVMYLVARRLDRDAYIGTMGILILAGSIPLFIGYWQADILNGEMARISALMVVPAMLGFGAGAWLRNRLGQEQFRKVVLFTFLLLGLNLVRKGLL